MNLHPIPVSNRPYRGIPVESGVLVHGNAFQNWLAQRETLHAVQKLHTILAEHNRRRATIALRRFAVCASERRAA